MSDNPISKAEHLEFAKRMEEEHKRTNQRLENLEEQTKQIMDIAISVKELAISVKQMAETQKDHSDKLETLEKRDGEMWRKAVGYIVSAIVGALVCFIFAKIGM